MEELFHAVKARNILAFIREIGFITICKFNYNLSLVSLHLIDIDRLFEHIKKLITYVWKFL